ncbi:MAG: exodeoxyribonuclease VII large subunit [Nitrospirae bacterium]|nr:exodeoxyribonuclease VII large subunit [Nitrospirota bacterium]MBF0539892.1 exodeoxyribonuclease VII large subunit [Nitrospirota bacterium]
MKQANIEKSIMSLYEFNLMIKDLLDNSLPESFLITAEIASLNVDGKGHCYLDLIEKIDNTIVAQMDGRIWANQYKSIAREFQDTTKIALTKGLKILIKASLNYHERYGMSLIIRNIDSSYTLGDMAKKRKEIIDRLTLEGLINRNKLIPLPLVPQRLAVISSSRAAGFGDFVNHISTNPYGYVINIKLFEAIMQGDNAEASILNAFAQCELDRENIDVVIIVRGGGAASELDCFDSYEIGRAIAMLSLPVISGIGHERDVTVIDEVSNTRVKTPTAAAGFIIETIREFEESLELLSRNIVKTASLKVTDTQRILLTITKQLENAAKRIILRNSYRLDNLVNSINGLMKRKIFQNNSDIQRLLVVIIDKSKKLILRQNERLNTLYKAINHLNPDSILKRGFSLTYLNGKVVRFVDQVKVKDKIETKLAKGKIISEVIDKFC